MRARIGADPVLVLTLGEQGYLLDDPATDQVIAYVPRRVVEGVPMVGAGDTFGADARDPARLGATPAAAAAAATEAVIRMLEAARPRRRRSAARSRSAPTLGRRDPASEAGGVVAQR